MKNKFNKKILLIFKIIFKVIIQIGDIFMEYEVISLDYKDENGDIEKRLIDSVQDMEKIEGFSAEEFFSSLDKIVKELSPYNSFEIIKKYPINKPIYLFGTLYYNLKDMDGADKLEKEFDYLKEFIDYEIDLFMIVNYLR